MNQEVNHSFKVMRVVSGLIYHYLINYVKFYRRSAGRDILKIGSQNGWNSLGFLILDSTNAEVIN